MNQLHEAAKNGDINKVRGLLETGAWDVNKRTEIWGFDEYLKHGVFGGSAPLHYAAWGGHSDVASLLIQHGADPCSTDEWGRTPLHDASEGGHSDVVALLIQHGADPCSTDDLGLAPLHCATGGGHSDVAALLIQHGADPCSTGWLRRTPLHFAAKGGHSDVAALLIQHGADPCSTDGDGSTPLHNAAEGGHGDVVALLLQHGADPCSTDEYGRTPLHFAAGGGHSDLAALLIQHGADPCSTDKQLRTPLHMAAEGGHNDVAALLIQHGADPCSTEWLGRLPSSRVPWTNQGLATLLKKFENGLVQNFIFILCLEHVAATMTLVEAYIIFKEDMSYDPPSELQSKKLARLNTWANTNGVKNIQELKVGLSNVGRHNLAVAAANHYAKIVQAIMDMSDECYETFCQDPMSLRHMITLAVCPTEQICEISMETDSYQYDAYLAHHSDDEKVVDEVRGQLESNGVRCSEPALAGTSIINSDIDPVKTAKRTVPFFSINSLESKLFKMTCDVALIEADERKEDVVVPVTIDVDPKALPPPYGTLNCVPYKSQDFIPKLVDAIKGPTNAPLYGELREENENLKRENAALRQQLEDSTALNRRLQAELVAAATPRQFVCEPEGM